MSPSAIEALVQEALPLAVAWGISVREAGPGRAVLHLPANLALLRPGGTLSGPALMALADIAIFAAWLGQSGGVDDARTQQLAITFLRPAGAGALLAESRIIRAGARVVYAEVWLRGEGATEPCAHVTSTWMRIDPTRA